jgi:2-polyprenyl-3-methyl-5-hydroxy-6-metoxy-1,4-benzoquinol methylase
MRKQDLKPEGHEYERLTHEEKIFLDDQKETGRTARDTLQQPVPPSWIEVENRAAALVRARTGTDLLGHVLARLRSASGVRMLSLGSGPGGIELALAREAREARITCIDLNPNLVQLGQERAEQEGLFVDFHTGDLNRLELEPGVNDVVFCHASLHHVLELERLVQQIRGSLRDGGELITVDVSTRNGYLMWPKPARSCAISFGPFLRASELTTLLTARRGSMATFGRWIQVPVRWNVSDQEISFPS